MNITAAAIEISKDGGGTLGTFPAPEGFEQDQDVLKKIYFLHHNAEAMLKRLSLPEAQQNRETRRAAARRGNAPAPDFVTACAVTVDFRPTMPDGTFTVPGAGFLIYGYHMDTRAGTFVGTPFSIVIPDAPRVLTPEQMPIGTIPVDAMALPENNQIVIADIKDVEAPAVDPGFVIGQPIYKDPEVEAFLQGRGGLRM